MILTPKERDQKYDGFIPGMFVGFIITSICFIGSWYNLKEPLKSNSTPPCNCLTLEETLLYVEKTEMWVDQLQRAKKGERNALIDSVNKYRTLLRSSGNEIQY